MKTTKLGQSQINQFVEHAHPHVAEYRKRNNLKFIGKDREETLLNRIIADVGEYDDDLGYKVDNLGLEQAVNYAFRILCAHDPYSTDEDQIIYDEARELVTYVLGKTSSQESLAANSPGQYVWLVIATLMAVAAVDNTVACQAAAGYPTIGEAKAAGIGRTTASDTATLIRAEADKAAWKTSHRDALSYICSIVERGVYPRELAPTRDAVEEMFPEYNSQAVQIFTIAAFATAQLNSGDKSVDFKFVFKEKD